MNNVKNIVFSSFMVLAFSTSIHGMEETEKNTALIKFDSENTVLVNLNSAEYKEQKTFEEAANDKLMAAAKNNDFKEALAALGQGANVNYQDRFGNTANHYATSHGLISGTNALCTQHNADKKIANNIGQTAEEIADMRAQEIQNQILINTVKTVAYVHGIPFGGVVEKFSPEAQENINKVQAFNDESEL